MPTVDDLTKFMDQLAPFHLAEDWDNVGLLVGDPMKNVLRVMTCLTITPESAAEAISKKAGLVIAHHPLPFRSTKRLTTETVPGRLLLDLVKADIAIISPHTAFDSALAGINVQLAEKFRLKDVAPLQPTLDDPLLGAARMGRAATESTLQHLVDRAKKDFKLQHVRFVGSRNQAVNLVAICCGSGGSFLPTAITAGCDAFVTGEATFHTCLEAKAHGVGLVLLGHHQSERFAVEGLVSQIQNKFQELEVWASEDEIDPIRIG